MLQFCIRLSVNLSHFICRFWVFGDSAHKFLRVWGCEEEERKEKERRKKKKRQESAGNRGREMIIVTINNRNNCNSVPEPDSAAPQLL